MNQFAGVVTFTTNVKINIDYDFVESIGKNGNKTIFIFGETDKKTVQELQEEFSQLGEIQSFDVSVSSNHKVEIIGESYDEGIYELVSFEGEAVNFSEILERFEQVEEVVSIRESEVSEKYGNKIIKVDFVY